jgi:hypothetical protein
VFEQTKALCQQFLRMGVSGFALIVYKDGQCVLHHMGGYASVDPVNHMTIFYAQHVIASPNRSLREWIYRSARADLLGEKVQIPGVDLNYDLTY